MRPFVALLVLLTASAVSAQTLPTAEPSLSDRIDTYLAPLVEARQFSGVVRVQRGDSLLYERAAGPRDLAGEPLRRDDVFRIGSITKPMTAAVVLRLAERGFVPLDSSACRIAARGGVACPQGWSTVTVRQLLNQTAGLPDYTTRPTYPFLRNEHATPGELLASLRGTPLVNAPGEAFNYSNTHYVLLGAVVEAVTQLPYAEVLGLEVTGPLELTHTAMESPEHQPVVGFQTQGTMIVPADSLDPSVAYAAGGVVSTAAEVAAFAHAAVAGPMFADSTRTAMLTPATPSGYGLGWIAVPYRGPVPELQGTHVVWHNGSIDGFKSIVMTIPERDLTVVILSNLVDADADGIGRDVLHLAYGLDVVPTIAETAVELPPSALEGIEGVYRLVPGFDLTVRVEGTHVMAQATGQGEIELFAAAPDEFFARAVPARIHFTRGTDGRAASLTLLQEGREMTAERVE